MPRIYDNRKDKNIICNVVKNNKIKHNITKQKEIMKKGKIKRKKQDIKSGENEKQEETRETKSNERGKTTIKIKSKYGKIK